jgi:predicted LPLAT superfamily acyltransferase
MTPLATAVPRRQHWAQLEERGVYFGLRATLLTYRLFGRIGFALMLYPIIAYYFLVSGSARRASLAFLARVAAQPAGREALGGAPGWRHAFRHMLCFGEAILDKIVTWTGEIALADLDLVDHQLFDALCLQGRGGVLIASHLGNVEVCRALGGQQRGLRINVLVHTRHSETFNRLMRDVSAASAMSLIQVTEVGAETAIMLRERVARGEFVVIVGDRTPPGRSVRVSWVPFLGRPAPFPQGPFYLAAMLRCPVLDLLPQARGALPAVFRAVLRRDRAFPGRAGARDRAVDRPLRRAARRFLFAVPLPMVQLLRLLDAGPDPRRAAG